MTLKPPYRGRTLKDVPPTETLTRPRVVILYWCSGCAAADLCRASAAAGARCRAAPLAGLGRAGQPRPAAGAALKNSQLNISGRDVYLSRRARGPPESSPGACERFLSAA